MKTKPELIFPAKNDLKGKNKPNTLVINSIFDDENDKSTKFEGIKNNLESKGYSVINKRKIFTNITEDQLLDHISSFYQNMKGRSIVVTYNAHGAPGWLFGEKSSKSEMEYTIAFAKLIKQIEAKLNVKVDAIMLNSCYSGFEVMSEDHQNYICSPARVLSILLPDVQVMGYVGKFSDSIVTGLAKPKVNYRAAVYNGSESMPKVAFQDVNVSLLSGCVLFRNGKSIGDSTIENNVYTICTYMPDFIFKNLRDSGTNLDRNSCVRANCHEAITGQLSLDVGAEHLNRMYNSAAYGAQQVKYAQKQQLQSNAMLFLQSDQKAQQGIISNSYASNT
ncbi:hypothetical protein L3V82_05325 [Thiotrichales bacterium 19S3-7]|nr:hypothetical protein [Thiotrichales bacterium 19S3-7]MCF6801514.1 hypothetical protein [Thiotrichales bacterium 19S3-11]